MLLKFATKTYPASRLEMKPDTAYFYGMICRKLDQFARTQTEDFPQFAGGILVKDLSAEIILAWLKHLIEIGRSAKTVNSYRNSLLTLWKYAKKKGLLQTEVPDLSDLPRCRVPSDSPNSWSPEQLERLLAACGRLRRCHQVYKDIQRSDYWISLILFLYDTGARIGAALEVLPTDIDLTNRLARLRSGSAKTLLEQPIRISEQTARAIEKILDPERSNVWPCGKRRNELYRRLNMLLEEAGLPTDRLSKFHRIRRTTATQTALHGSLEMAQRQLGHTSLKMTLRYIDQRVVRPCQAVDVMPTLHVG
jgi:integrase